MNMHELNPDEALALTDVELKTIAGPDFNYRSFINTKEYKKRMFFFKLLLNETDLNIKNTRNLIVGSGLFETRSYDEIYDTLIEIDAIYFLKNFYKTIKELKDTCGLSDIDIGITHTSQFEQTHTSEKGTTMFNQLFNNQFKNAFTKNLFSEVSNLAWDLMSNSVAIIKESELCSFDIEQSCVTVNVASSFSMPLPGFAQAVPIDTVKLGDIFVKDGLALGWIIELIKDKEDKSIVKLKYMKVDGTEKTFTPPKIVNPLTGTTNTVMISRDLTGMLGGNDNKDSFKSSLLPLMMMNGGNIDMSTMMPMMLMSAQSGSDGNMMQMFMMQQMMSNNKNSPFN